MRLVGLTVCLLPRRTFTAATWDTCCSAVAAAAAREVHCHCYCLEVHCICCRICSSSCRPLTGHALLRVVPLQGPLQDV